MALLGQMIILESERLKKVSGNNSEREALILLGYVMGCQTSLLQQNLNEEVSISKQNLLLPVIEENNSMNFFPWKRNEALQVNKFGMLEPCLINKPLIPDLMLVPLLAFDSDNNRLGYGKGFYDKFLNKFLRNRKKIITIGVAFLFQKYNKLPISKLDIKLDYILTEKGLQK